MSRKKAFRILLPWQPGLRIGEDPNAFNIVLTKLEKQETDIPLLTLQEVSLIAIGQSRVKVGRFPIIYNGHRIVLDLHPSVESLKLMTDPASPEFITLMPGWSGNVTRHVSKALRFTLSYEDEETRAEYQRILAGGKQ
jgi:hypothetical protein